MEQIYQTYLTIIYYCHSISERYPFYALSGDSYGTNIQYLSENNKKYLHRF